MDCPILVTGAAGFIGFHTALRLLEQNIDVVGVDVVNDYYDPDLKYARIEKLKAFENFKFEKFDLADKEKLDQLFKRYGFKKVIHLAAQAGVRYSLTNPDAYIQSNIVAFCNLLEACRYAKIGHFVYASSSSVYGANKKLPFSVDDNVDHPVSLYAASKKSNELMAHCYSHLYELPTTGLRFFTVYGPWGRPDMALFIFTKAIMEGKPIEVFNHGRMQRDFTYIDDIVEALLRVVDKVPEPQNFDHHHLHPASSHAPYRVYNIGNDQPIELNYMIEVIEKTLGKKATKKLMPMQPGDVAATWANVDALKQAVDFQPTTSIEDGIKAFVDWYSSYYIETRV